MKKFLFACLILIAAAGTASAQSFFKALPKLEHKTGAFSLATDSVMNAIRPVVNVASYAITSGGNRLLTGAGVAYEHLKYDVANTRWNTVWSINGLAWYAASLDGTTNSRFAYGITVGVLNNLIMAGVATDSKRGYFTLGVGIGLNN